MSATCGHGFADPVEIVQRQLDLRLVGDGEQVENGVGRAAQGHHDSDGVFERVLGHDLAGPDPGFEQLDDGLARLVGVVVTPAVNCRGRRTGGKRHPERLGRRRHRVGREHTGAAPFGGTGAPLDEGKFLVGELARRPGPHRLEDADYVQCLAVSAPSWQYGPPVQEDRGQVDPGSSHEHPRQGLVTAGQRHERVEAFGMHHRLHRIRDDLPADQRRPHPLGPHRDAVRDGDGDELEGEPAGVAHALLGPLGQPVERQVARCDLVPRRRHAHLGFVPVGVRHADGAEHGPGRGSLGPVGDFAAARFEVAGHMDTLGYRRGRAPGPPGGPSGPGPPSPWGHWPV